MKIIKKSKMPNGTDIQMEDWKNDYAHIKTLIIGTYPKAKNTSVSGLIERNKTFRLELSNFENDKQVENIFDQLEKGTISLEELSDYFYNGHKDMYYLGIVDNEELQEDLDEEEI